MESAVAGLSVGTVVGLSVGAGSVDVFISTNLIFGTVSGAFGDLDAFLEGKRGKLAAPPLRARGRGIEGWWWYWWRRWCIQNFRNPFLMGFAKPKNTRTFSR